MEIEEDLDSLLDFLSKIVYNDPPLNLFLNKEILISTKEHIDTAEDELSIFLNLILNPYSNLKPIQSKVLFKPKKLMKSSTLYSQLETIKGDFLVYQNCYEEIAKQFNKIEKEICEKIYKFKPVGKEIEKKFDLIKEKLESKLKQFITILNLPKEGLKDIDPANIPEDKRNEFIIDKGKQLEKLQIFADKINQLEANYNLIYKNVSEKIKVLGNNMKLFPFYLENLGGEILKQINTFQNIGTQVEGITDPNEMNDYLITIKQGFLTIINKIHEEKDNLDYQLNLMKIHQEENIDEVIQSCTDLLIEMNEISKDISGGINYLRAKNNFEKREEKIFFVEIDDIEDFSKDIVILQQSIVTNLKLLKAKYEKIEETPKKINVQFKLDIMVMFDLNYTMQTHLSNVQKALGELANQIIHNTNSNCQLRLGFIGYSDVDDDCEYMNIELTPDHQSVINAVQYAQICGQGEHAKDVAGAFNLCLGQKWEANARYALLITDFPPHGEMFHSHSIIDEHSNKDYGLMDLIQKMIKTKINLFSVELNSNNDIFFNILKEKYEGSNSGLKFETRKMGNDPEEMLKMIVETAVQTYLGNRIEQAKFK